jgi:chitinase
MDPTSFPQGIYTHIYFAFVSIDAKSFKVMPYATSDEKLYPQLASLKTRDPGQEFWLSIGGWTFSDTGSPTATTFSDLVNAPEHRQQAFFTSLTLFMQTWGFTGVDIDWEYPVDHDRNGRASDFKAYPRFMKRLKSALSGYKYGLSVTLPTSYWYLQHFDLENIQPSVDWFNVMSYDLHGAWDIGNKWTGAYVGAHTNLTEIESALDLLWRNKVSPSKVVLGLSFYGRAVTLANPSCSEPGCPYVSAGDPGQCSNEAGILFNSEISELIRSKKLRPKLHKDAAVKTIQWNNDQWVSYDDKDTWKLKANFLKSQCLSGVLVWAVDYDDEMHTYSKGLAAALGIKIKTPSDEDLTIKLPSKKADSNDFCYFTNCGQTCPRGYTEIVRGDKPSQLMLDGSQCDGRGTQTLCCPKSSKVPKCQWRGFHNSGHCTVGCNSGEVEVGTIFTGCKRSGWQSACCESTPSTEPWSKCAWTDMCVDDKTCPSGYSNFVVGSREGWGGQRICSNGKKYNYCCTETPKAFKNCKWAAWEDNTPKSGLCTDSCPHGSTRIAEQQVTQMYNGLLPGHAEDCFKGHESFCCLGDQSSGKDEEPQIDYRDNIEREFTRLLREFLKDPVCLPEWMNQYTSDDSAFDQGLGSIGDRATDNGARLDKLLDILVNEVTSRRPNKRIRAIFDFEIRQAHLEDTAANLTAIADETYLTDIHGRPAKPPRLVLVQSLCNLKGSRAHLESASAARDALCTIPSGGTPTSDKRHLLQARVIDNINEARQTNQPPTSVEVLEGIYNGELSLHYLRWLSSGPRPTQVILEAGYWIGPDPGVRPTDPTLRPRFQDPAHTGVNQDRWIVLHFHIPLDQHTFQDGSGDWHLGCNTISMYHSQNTTGPTTYLPNGRVIEPRAEFV